jgi:hypothetical protein
VTGIFERLIQRIKQANLEAGKGNAYIVYATDVCPTNYFFVLSIFWNQLQIRKVSPNPKFATGTIFPE